MIIVSNGFNQCHLAYAAEELDERGMLHRFITGAYPSSTLTHLLAQTTSKSSRKMSRLLARRRNINDNRVVSLCLPESLDAVARLTRRPDRSPTKSNLKITNWSHHLYGHLASRYINRNDQAAARIFHYRAGFGLRSTKKAGSLGLITLCDFSTVHPNLMSHLVECQGQLPEEVPACTPSLLFQLILRDTELADHVLVNSDWVKRTFMHQGWREENISVAYLGVDNSFLSALDSHKGAYASCDSKTMHFLFAGSFIRAKGADVVCKAFSSPNLSGWKLSVAGAVPSWVHEEFPAFSRDPRVSFLGTLPREELARTMTSADVLVFPSLSEGSARVVFEALAAGCYIITTENSGSIVNNERHGTLVAPASVEHLRHAIASAISQPYRIKHEGANNAATVRQSYTQHHYGERLCEIYDTLLNRFANPPSATPPLYCK